MTALRLSGTVAAFAFMVIGCVSTTYGSGYGIFTQGASALGQADAVVAHTGEPSAIFFNPALMNELAGTQAEIGTTAVVPIREFKNNQTGSTAETRDTVFFPSTFYITHALNDNVSAGLGVFNPFGLGTDWGDTWEGRYLATKSEITTFNINPALSYRIIPGLSIAAGIDIILLDATLESKIPSTALGIPGPAFDIRQKFSGSGNGLGYNAGLYYAFARDFSFGASYRSQVKVDVDGDVAVDIFPQKTNAKTSLKLPQQVFAGIAYKVSDRAIVEVGMRWEDWRAFKELKVELEGQPSPPPAQRNWHSTFAVNAGGKYKINETYSLSAGYLYGWNPVPDETFEPAIPDSNTHLFCLGSDVSFQKVKFSLSYAYQMQYEREKTTNQYGPLANGTYNSSVHLLGISAVYRF